LEQISKFSVPCSNVVRLNDFLNGEGCLTGAVLMQTKEFCAEALKQAQQTIDEQVLHCIVKAAGIGSPPTTPGLDECSLNNVSDLVKC